ncbi:MAG: magnesium transporter [Omnitrophica bacterium GWA2_52_8]|nr:MAG: magnesium transporter [Omnitrophica bacterium GWA2_52_8]
MPTDAKLLPLIQKYFEEDPVRTAHMLETLPEEEAVDVLKGFPNEMAVRLVRHCNAHFAAALLQRLDYPLFRRIVEDLDPQQAAAIFFEFPNHLRELLLLQLEDRKKKQIQEILTFPEDSAGRLMTTKFIALRSDFKVKDAIQKIRILAKQGAPASYAYVIDPESRLVGVMNMRDVILANENDTVESVMRKDVFAVEAFMDREKVAQELSSRHFFAMPVVDSEYRLLGVVHAEKLIGGMQEEATEDLQRMFGASGDERAFSPVRFSLRTRLPWLHVNLVTAFMAAGVISLFEDIISKVTVLAVFMPVVAGQGGNAGAQSLAVVLRGLVMREIPAQKAVKFVTKEMMIGVINGVVIGLVTGAVAWLWQGNPYLGLVIGLGMLVNLIFAGISGAAIPLMMKSIGQDPAQCSNIILTTVTDIVGFFAFLGFAVLFQNHLI